MRTIQDRTGQLRLSMYGGQGFCHLTRHERAAVPSFLGSCYSLLRVRSLVFRKGLCETVQAFADGRPRLREVY